MVSCSFKIVLMCQNTTIVEQKNFYTILYQCHINRTLVFICYKLKFETFANAILL